MASEQIWLVFRLTKDTVVLVDEAGAETAVPADRFNLDLDEGAVLRVSVDEHDTPRWAHAERDWEAESRRNQEPTSSPPED